MDAYDRQQLELPVAKDAAGTFHHRCQRRRAGSGDVLALSNAGLVTTLVGPAQREAAERLTAAHPSLREIGSLYPAELRSYGLTQRAIDKLAAAFELAKRYGQVEFVPGAPFRGSNDVYAHFRERLGDEPVEHFFVILLD